MAEPPIPTATQLSAKVEFLNTLGEMQDNIATTSILTHDSQKNELEMLRSHRWHVVRLLVGAVVVIALLLLANILMLPRVYPVLFCWWRSHYKVLGRSCKPSPVEGAFQVSAWHIALRLTYPSIYRAANIFTLLKDVSMEAAQFLQMCIDRHGKYITPFMWAGNSAQILGKHTLADWLPTIATSRDLNVCSAEAVIGKDNCSVLSTSCKDKLFTYWQASCEQGNPFVPLFPNTSEELYCVPAVVNHVTAQAAADKTTAMSLLYEGGLVHLAQNLADHEEGEEGLQFSGSRLGALEWYQYCFTPLSSTVPTTKSKCKSMATLKAVTTGTGVATGVAGIASMLGGGPNGMVAAVVVGLASGAATAGLIMTEERKYCASVETDTRPTGKVTACTVPNPNDVCGLNLVAGASMQTVTSSLAANPCWGS